MTSANPRVATISVPAALNPETLEAFSAELSGLDPEKVSFVLLKGGPAVFCRGLDIHWIAREPIADPRTLARFSGILELLHAGPFVTVAVVEGDAMGGGVGIVAACDYALAAPAAAFALPEGQIGFTPGIIFPFLLDKLSANSVKLMVLTGRRYSAEAMATWGLIHEVAPAAGLDQAAMDFVRGIRSCKRHAIAQVKKLASLANPRRDELVELGIRSLMDNLNNPSVRARLNAMAELLDS